jgi:hypothetical protein
MGAGLHDLIEKLTGVSQFLLWTARLENVVENVGKMVDGGDT